MRILRACVLLSLALLLPGPLEAQIDGVVLDRFGAPLVSARVELLATTEVLAVEGTDTRGRFSFDAHPTARAVRASALGFTSRTVSVGDLLGPLEIILRPVPIELPALEAAVPRVECRQADGPAARRIWSGLRNRYRMPPDYSHWAAAITEIRRGTTPPGEFGEVEESRFTWAQTGGNDIHPLWSAAELSRNGFARRRDVSSFDGVEEAWDYVDLGGAESLSLLKEAFAKQHHLWVLERGEDTLVIAFCPRSDERAGMRGRVVLTAELKITKVRWSYTTPAPDENAGGEATFDPGVDFLFPETGIFWRRTSGGEYFQFARRYSPWIVGSEDEVRRGLREFMDREGR